MAKDTVKDVADKAQHLVNTTTTGINLPGTAPISSATIDYWVLLLSNSPATS